jgi:AraC-like DNA-binding protein
LFLHKTGLTVHAALRQRRIIEAQRLLLRTTLTVDEIARRCGFARRDSFTRAFRTLANCSPKHYRRLGHLEGEVLKE